MQRNNLKVSREQLGILQHLDKESVRYIAVGDFAMLAIDPARMLQQAQLWVEPVKANLQRFNRALKNMFGPRTTRQIDVNTAPNTVKTGRQLTLGVGPFRVGIYLGIGGFRPEEFGKLYERSQAAQIAVPGQPGDSFTTQRLNNSDLCHQMRSEGFTHTAWNLKTVEKSLKAVDYETTKTLEEHKGQNVLYDRLGLEKPPEIRLADVADKLTNNVENHKGHFVLYGQANISEANQSLPHINHLEHKGQNVPYDEKATLSYSEVIRNRSELRQKLDMEAVLTQYGFAAATEQKENDPWRTYERTVNGVAQQVIVASLKDDGQKHFYEVSNRAFQGDVLDLIAGLEKPKLQTNETIDQRVFRVTDQLISDPKLLQPQDHVPDLRSISRAYFLRAASSVQEQTILSQHYVQPLTRTDTLEAHSLNKATLYAPEFDGRIKNVSLADPLTKQPQTGVAFPLHDPSGKITALAVVSSNQPDLYVKHANSPAENRNESLWHSNRYYWATSDIKLADEKPIPIGTVGVVSRQDAQTIAFQCEQEGQARKAILPVMDAKNVLLEQAVSRLIIARSPMDTLAMKQLNPEATDERRLYVATIGSPTAEQTTYINKLVQKNPQAEVVITTDRSTESYRTAINYLALAHPASNLAVLLRPEITHIDSALNRQPVGQEVFKTFYPHEPALKTEEDLLRRFGYHTYSQPNHQPNSGMGINPIHLDHLLAGRQGITTGSTSPTAYSDNLTLKALTSALQYAELHKIPLSEPLKAIRDTPMVQQLIADEKRDMRRVYEQEHVGKNQLTIEVRQPVGQDSTANRNDQFLNRFITTLTMTANQVRAQAYPERVLDIVTQPNKPVLETNRQTLVDSKQGQLVTRSTLILPNEMRVLEKAMHLLTAEINYRQGQRLLQIVQPAPNQKTMTETLAARHGQSFSPTHRSGLGQPEAIKFTPNLTTSPSLKQQYSQADLTSEQPSERPRQAVKVS